MIIIGDIHGWTKSYTRLVDRLESEHKSSIQIGDMGLGFKGVGLHKLPDNHKFIRGNHDSPKKCQQHHNYLGEFGYDSQTGIFHIGGAWSIDRAMRIPDISWWAGEELSWLQLDECVQMYKNCQPKFVVSHECPSKVSQVLLGGILGPYFSAKLECGQSRTGQAMQIMLEAHQPKEWVFGHYHIDKTFYTPGFDTKFTCVGGIMSSGEAPHYYELNLGEPDEEA
jgi:hypothetical protein